MTRSCRGFFDSLLCKVNKLSYLICTFAKNQAWTNGKLDGYSLSSFVGAINFLRKDTATCCTVSCQNSFAIQQMWPSKFKFSYQVTNCLQKINGKSRNTIFCTCDKSKDISSKMASKKDCTLTKKGIVILNHSSKKRIDSRKYCGGIPQILSQAKPVLPTTRFSC